VLPMVALVLVVSGLSLPMASPWAKLGEQPATGGQRPPRDERAYKEQGCSCARENHQSLQIAGVPIRGVEKTRRKCSSDSTSSEPALAWHP
jgi:hypothetical protein